MAASKALLGLLDTNLLLTLGPESTAFAVKNIHLLCQLWPQNADQISSWPKLPLDTELSVQCLAPGKGQPKCLWPEGRKHSKRSLCSLPESDR